MGEKISNDVKEIVSLAFKHIDALIFPNLYPDAKNYIPNDQTRRAMPVRNRLFNEVSLFRDCIDWMFYHFDTMEKYRLVDNNARTTSAAETLGKHTRDSVLSSSKYDYNTIYNDDVIKHFR